LALFICVLAVWQAVVLACGIKPYLVPAPTAVWAAARENQGELLRAVALTGCGALSGFAVSCLIGSLIAFVFAQSRLIQRSCYPYAIFLQTVPIVAIAPLIILWFGYGFTSVVVVASILSLFPIITNGTAGLTTVDRNLLELFALNNATRRQLLFKLRLPNALPYFVTGAKISSGLSVIGAIVGEFFAGLGANNHGLGYLISMTSGQSKIAYLFAAIMASTLLGLTVFILINWVGQRLVGNRG
jgi:NitT/TauT family transport system permease protein